MAKKKSKKQKEIQISNSYKIFSFCAVVIMIIAAYITYGYQVREVLVSFEDGDVQTDSQTKTAQKESLGISADLSLVPSDKVIEDILNSEIPEVCDDCEEDPLECFKEYTFDKVLVQQAPYQNQLFIKLFTGKNEKRTYTVVLDLSDNNRVIKKEGEIDKKRCRDVVEDNDVENYEIMLKSGEDPDKSHYTDTPFES